MQYLKKPLTRDELLDLIGKLEDPAADLVRKDGFFKGLELDPDDYTTPEAVADLLVEHPRLMQRPVLVRGKRAIIGRPKDRVAAFLVVLTTSTRALDATSDPETAALEFEDWRRRSLLPHYRECALTDSVASAQLRAGLEGRSVPSNAPDIELPDGHPISAHDLERAAGLDPDLFRIATRAAVMLDDERRVESHDVAARVQAVLAAHPTSRARMPTDEPPRAAASKLHDRAYVTEVLAAWS